MAINTHRLQLRSQQFTSTALEFLPSGKPIATVVCLHGFPDNMHSFNEIAPLFTEAGYRVVAPTLRGYETSSVMPPSQYYLTDMASDVLEWLPQISSEPVHLIGHDWGGAIGSLVATQAELKSYSCLAIPPVKGFFAALARYPKQLRYSWYMLFFQLRGLADKRFANNDYAFVERLWRDWSPGWQFRPEQLETAKATFRQPGVAKASLSYYRCQLSFGSQRWRSSFKALGKPISVPSLYLAGESDGCMYRDFFDKAMDESQFQAGVALEILPRCGHFLHREQPSAVANRILQHIQANH